MATEHVTRIPPSSDEQSSPPRPALCSLLCHYSHVVLEQFEPSSERDATVGDDAHQVESDVVVGLAAGGDTQPVGDHASELVCPLLVRRPRACRGHQVM